MNSITDNKKRSIDLFFYFVFLFNKCINIVTIIPAIKININNESPVEQGKQFAIALAEEAVQCAAVCEKLLETFDGINGDEK